MRTIPLHGKVAAGRVALIDDGDYELVSQHRWHVREQVLPGRRRVNGPYAMRNIHLSNGKWTVLAMHTLITGYAITDHEDHDGLNNQRSNLRDATEAQNSYNQRKQPGVSSSRFKGVSWDRDASKWVACIRIDNKLRKLGRFTSETDAARAYDSAAHEAWGEFAWPNFPNDAAG
jgi:hypothetical protein